MEWEEYIMARDFIEKRSIELMEHEEKPAAKTASPQANFRILTLESRTFYLMFSDNFTMGIIEHELITASQRYSEQFGTGNANDIVNALYKMYPWGKPEDYARYLASEHFMYIMENVNGIMDNKLLRIDLFRDMKKNKEGGYDFVGGLFHALKHFSYKGLPLATHKAQHDIPDLYDLLKSIAEAFFIHDGDFKKETAYTVKVPLEGSYFLQYEFYYEPVTRVYFLKTCFKTE